MADLGLDFGVDFLPEVNVDFAVFVEAAGVEVPLPLALFLIIRTCSVIALGVQSVPIAAAMLARISLLNLRSNFKKTSVKSCGESAEKD